MCIRDRFNLLKKQVNETLYKLFKCTCVRGSMLWNKALKIFSEIKVENLVASNGWLECVRQWHNILFKTISDEGSDVPVNEVNDQKDRLWLMTNDYVMF